MTEKLLTQKDVAKQLGLTPNSVRIFTAEGLLDYRQLPDLNMPRYRQSQVGIFLETMTRTKAEEIVFNEA